MNDKLDKKIESILFWKAEPVKISDLSVVLSKNDSEIRAGLEELERKLADRGLSLIVTEDKVALVTSTDPECSSIIEGLQKEELTKDLSKAALETLSIILYRGPIRRADIDYIRGVNSQFTLRALLVRGLAERKQDKNDERAYIYEASVDTLAHLGVSRINDLPEYVEVNADINSFFDKKEENEIQEDELPDKTETE